MTTGLLPTVSVIVPVYNGARYLAVALHSITAQEYAPLQVLVVDDGSTDESAAVAAAFPAVTVLCKPHSGLSPTLNHGLRHAHGDFIAFLDADDRWLPGKLTRQISAFQQQPELDMVFGYARQFTVNPETDGARETYYEPQPGYAKLTMMARRAAFLRIGLFDETGEMHDFLGWFARAQQAELRSVMLPDLLGERRIHDGNFGRTNQADQRQHYLNTLRALVQQRRQKVEAFTNG